MELRSYGIINVWHPLYGRRLHNQKFNRRASCKMISIRSYQSNSALTTGGYSSSGLRSASRNGGSSRRCHARTNLRASFMFRNATINLDGGRLTCFRGSPFSPTLRSSFFSTAASLALVNLCMAAPLVPPPQRFQSRFRALPSFPSSISRSKTDRCPLSSANNTNASPLACCSAITGSVPWAMRRATAGRNGFVSIVKRGFSCDAGTSVNAFSRAGMSSPSLM